MINAQEFFTHALHDSEAVTALLAYTEGIEGDHLPNIFEYPCEEELGDNPGKPYIVVQNTGTTKAEGCKDFEFDSENDITTIEVVCVTSSKDEAKVLAKVVRDAIREALNELSLGDADQLGFTIEDVNYSDRGVQFDVQSGNYFVALSYRNEIQI